MGGYKQDEWNKGEKEGSGGPLPMVDGLPIHIHKEIGKGTLDDPCVSYLFYRGYPVSNRHNHNNLL